MPVESPAPLDYAAPARTPLRRHAWRLFLLGWAALTIYLAYDYWVPWLRLQVPMLQEQRRSLRFTEPADRIVFDDDPARIAGLLKSPGYALASSGTYWPVPPVTPAGVGVSRGVTLSTAADNQLQAFEGAEVILARLEELRNPMPRSGGLFGGGALFGGSYDRSFAVFLHRRRAASADRLVVIKANWFAGSPSPKGFATDDTKDLLTFSYEVIETADWTGTPRALTSKMITPPVELRQPRELSFLRLYAGQPDPGDPSRFTIDYETGDGRGTVEGRLQPDDDVEMRILSGPATRPAPVEKPERLPILIGRAAHDAPVRVTDARADPKD